jgi:hypothetical protein
MHKEGEIGRNRERERDREREKERERREGCQVITLRLIFSAVARGNLNKTDLLMDL